MAVAAAVAVALLLRRAGRSAPGSPDGTGPDATVLPLAQRSSH